MQSTSIFKVSFQVIVFNTWMKMTAWSVKPMDIDVVLHHSKFEAIAADVVIQFFLL